VEITSQRLGERSSWPVGGVSFLGGDRDWGGTWPASPFSKRWGSFPEVWVRGASTTSG
jgi:hypothetical protein